jgi:hypothetical protein
MNPSETQLTVTNSALSKCGVASLTLTTDATKPGRVTLGVYPQQRDYCLSQNPWTFATKTVLLTPMVVLWQPNTAYGVGGFVNVGAIVYICLVSHTSTNFTADLASAYWAASNWVTATAYTFGQFVNQGGSVYCCLVPHTSGVFATDLSNNYWVVQTNLTINLINFSDGVNLAYALPTDWIKPYKWNFDGAIRRIEGSIIYSDTRGLAVKYIWQNNTPSTYTPEFVDALATKIAAEVCYDLTNNAQKAAALKVEFDDKLAQAVAADSQGSTPDQAICDSWEISRLSGGMVSIPLPGQVTFQYPGPTS